MICQLNSETDHLVGYQVGAFAFVSAPTVRLITGYYAALPKSAQEQVLELRSNQISLNDFQIIACHAGYAYCEAPVHEEDVHVPPAKLLDNALLAGWKQIEAKWAPVVSVTTNRRVDCPANCGSR